MSVSTHVLDTGRGRPAGGVPVRLEHHDGSGWNAVADGTTDADGRLAERAPTRLAGRYRLIFDTAAHSAFFPEVTIGFTVADPAQHYHVPLLLSPFAYSTYRGS